jgi:hypothetical protein
VGAEFVFNLGLDGVAAQQRVQVGAELRSHLRSLLISLRAWC